MEAYHVVEGTSQREHIKASLNLCSDQSHFMAPRENQVNKKTYGKQRKLKCHNFLEVTVDAVRISFDAQNDQQGF